MRPSQMLSSVRFKCSKFDVVGYSGSEEVLVYIFITV